MHRKISRDWLGFVVLLLSIVLFSSPAGFGAQAPYYQLVKLPSGKEIKMLGVGKIYPSPDRPVLLFKYETDLSIDDKEALRKEVDEIWASFRLNVERENLSEAIISANEPLSSDSVSKGRSYDFEYRKAQDGTWQMISK